MVKTWLAVLAGALLVGAAGCSGSSDSAKPDVKAGGNANNNAAQPAAGAAPAQAAPAAAPKAPDANAADPNAGQVADGSLPAAGNGDISVYLPANVKMAVGAVIPPLQKKENPLGENLLGQLRPLTAVLANCGIPVDQIDRLWAASDRDKGDMLICVRTRGTMNRANLVKGLKVTSKPETVGKATVYNLPDNATYKNAVALVDTRTALIGRRSTIEAAVKENQPGPVRDGLDAIQSSRPFYWIAGDDAFGQKHFEKAVFGMLKIRTADGIKLNSKGFAMGFAEAGSTQAPAGGQSSTATPGGPPGMGPPGMGPPGMGPPGMGPAGAPGMGPAGPIPGGSTTVGGQPAGAAPAKSTVELVVAGTFNSEALVGALEEDIKELFALADAADVARQDAAARAKSRQAAQDKATSQDPAGGNQPGGNAPGGAPMPGAPAGGAPMPVGGPAPGGAPMPGAMPGGAPGMGMMPGGNSPSGGQSKSTIVRPTLIKDKVYLRVVRVLSTDEEDQIRTLGWFSGFSKVGGFAPINDGILSGTLEMVAAATTTWESRKSNEYRGSIAVPNAARFAHHGWMTQLLPYLGREDMYVRIDFKKSPLDPKNRKYGYQVIPEFLNAGSDVTAWSGYPYDGMALTHFVGMSGVEVRRNDVAALYSRTDPRAGIFGYDEIAKPAQIKDGAAQTLMLIGSDRVAGPWFLGGGANIRGARAPYFNEFTGFSSAGLSEAGAVVLFADGSSRIVSAKIDPEVFKALCTIQGAESVDMGKINVADANPGNAK